MNDSLPIPSPCPLGADRDAAPLCPLSRVRAGTSVRIRQLCAPPEMSERLREIGFCEDQVVRLVAGKANFICQVCNARLALSSQLAQSILVEPIERSQAA